MMNLSWDEKMVAVDNWDQMLVIFTKQDIIAVDLGYEEFWKKKEIIKNVGTGKRPIFVRSEKDRQRPITAGTVLHF